MWEWAPSECSPKNKLRENCFTGSPRRVYSQVPTPQVRLVSTKRSVWWGPRGASASLTLLSFNSPSQRQHRSLPLRLFPISQMSKMTLQTFLNGRDSLVCARVGRGPPEPWPTARSPPSSTVSMGLPAHSQLVIGEVQQQPILLSGEWIAQASVSCSCFILISIIIISERENSHAAVGLSLHLASFCKIILKGLSIL